MSGLRIALINWTARLAGGVETYLRDLIPALTSRGHTVSLFAEREVPADRAPITSEPARVLTAPDQARAILAEWRPDVLFLHGVDDAAIEQAVLRIGPAVYFAHYYRGTCISGEKAHKFPTPVPCVRVFGPPCLALFYPRRCGGLNPATMVRDYAVQRGRLARLRTAARLVTGSAHMREEYLRHGFPPDRVVHLPLPVPESPPPSAASAPAAPCRLLWAGRMERPKGADLFLEAAARAARTLGRTLDLTLLGDGRERPALEALAGRLAASGAPIHATFGGWVAADAMDRMFQSADLLVMSSVWPEPYGRVGLEAGRHGVPTAAFAVGGIPEWLRDGVNGRLAPGTPPRAEGLAAAIVASLRDPAEYHKLAAGALRAAERARFGPHVQALERLFDSLRGHG